MSSVTHFSNTWFLFHQLFRARKGSTNSKILLPSQMCPGSNSPPLFCRKQAPKGHRVRVLRLNRMRRERSEEGDEKKMEMEIRNLKLYMRNQNLREENERLRKQALLLHQENRSLVAELQQMFSKPIKSDSCPLNP